jgi:hypothetical protein
MRKTTSLLTTLITSSLLAGGNAQAKDLKLRCESEYIVERKVENDEKITLHANHNFFFYSHENGFVNISGNIKTNSSTYTLNRRINFVYSDVDKDGIYTLKTTTMQAKPWDNVPNNVISSIYDIHPDGSGYLMDFAELKKGIILLSHLSQPLMLCKEF